MKTLNAGNSLIVCLGGVWISYNGQSKDLEGWQTLGLEFEFTDDVEENYKEWKKELEIALNETKILVEKMDDDFVDCCFWDIPDYWYEYDQDEFDVYKCSTIDEIDEEEIRSEYLLKRSYFYEDEETEEE